MGGRRLGRQAGRQGQEATSQLGRLAHFFLVCLLAQRDEKGDQFFASETTLALGPLHTGRATGENMEVEEGKKKHLVGQSVLA